MTTEFHNETQNNYKGTGKGLNEVRQNRIALLGDYIETQNH